LEKMAATAVPIIEPPGVGQTKPLHGPPSFPRERT
jgi:hypothetical protein